MRTAAIPGCAVENMEKEKSLRKKKSLRESFGVIGEIFEPMIPGIITAGLCSGFASLIAQLVPDYSQTALWEILHSLFSLVSSSFMSFMSAWIGYSACKRFGGTAILGGMLGMITELAGINSISQALGLYNAVDPGSSILISGRGGVLAAILGAWIIAKLESFIRKRMPKSIDFVVTPVLVLLITLVPYILIIMPLIGLISIWLCDVVSLVCMSDSVLIRVVAGYICAALFLVAVMMGMQYAFVAVYSMQLQTLGYVTLFPTLAMAGAGQVGAGFALLIKARSIKNERYANVAAAAILPGLMGIGMPLSYGVTLPVPKSFVMACLGGGFGGAFIMATGVASSGWGASGILGIPMMGAGPVSAVRGMLFYVIGLTISCVMGFILTFLTVKKEELADV